MQLHIQDPDDPASINLLEAIMSACAEANRGGGFFAFASAGGTRLLLYDSAFRKFANHGSFDLVIGLDAVTDIAALDLISAAIEDLPNVQARAFLHERGGTLFHPKMCWFGNDQQGTVIVGSGNLTAGGLRDNWESFATMQMALGTLNPIEQQWRDWTEGHSDRLLALTDERVRDRARRNIRLAVRVIGDHDAGDEFDAEEEKLLPAPLAGTVALVAEIPGGGDRWEQANFDLATFSEFFGATPGQTVRVFLQHVNSDGTLDNPESRPSVAVKSHNYRFELAAAKGLAYPSAGRPIGVFVRLATRQFRYRLSMPGDKGHAELERFLSSRWHGPAGRMRRLVVDAALLRSEWKDPEFWSALEAGPGDAAI